MRIEFDNIVLTSDCHNFILNKKCKDKKGEDILKPFAYYPTLRGAFTGLLIYKTSKSTATSVKELSAELHELTKLFQERV